MESLKKRAQRNQWNIVAVSRAERGSLGHYRLGGLIIFQPLRKINVLPFGLFPSHVVTDLQSEHGNLSEASSAPCVG